MSSAVTGDVLTPDMLDRQAFSALPLEAKLADVCSGCGEHAVTDPGERVRALREGAVYRCTQCSTSWRWEGGGKVPVCRL